MDSFVTGWYLLYTRPRHEKKVISRLDGMNIESLLPTRKTLRIWHDRKKYIDEPLFPSYVFVYLNNLQSYYGGMDVDGVLYYVKSGKEIARVKDTVVDNIRLATKEANDVEVSERHFYPGQQLAIHNGVLTGLTGEVVQVNGKQKLLIRVDLLQRNLLVSLSAQDLMPLK